MNKKYLLKIPIKAEVTKDNTKIVETVTTTDVVINTMLKPMYTTESELLALFVDDNEYDKYYLKAREIAFTSSIRADDYLKSKLRMLNLSDEHSTILKRELAQCFAVNTMANFFFKGYGESLSRSKTLGEFSVSTSVKNNTYALKSIIDNSNDCIKEAKKAVDEIALMTTSAGCSFNKGRLNIGNKFSYRTWFHNNLPERSTQIFASEKYRHPNGNIYKDGFNTEGLDNVSNSGTYYPRRIT